MLAQGGLAGWRILAVNDRFVTDGLVVMDIRARMELQFKPDAAGEVDAVIALALPDGEWIATFGVRDGRLTFEPDREPDVTFTFDREETAQAIVLGGADPIDAFMAGRFRSDGHLPLAFVLLGMFRQDFAAAPPP